MEKSNQEVVIGTVESLTPKYGIDYLLKQWLCRFWGVA